MNDQNENEEKWDEEFPDQPGYLYHKQTPQHRKRFSRQASSPRALRQEPAPDPARKVLVSNIRTAVVVFCCMFAVLFAAIYIAKRSWDVRQRRARGERSLSEVAKRAPATGSLSEKGDDEPSGANRAMRKQLDTDAIRKAVFLSKRAAVLAESGEYDEAITRYREALEVWPYLTEGWAEIGKLYLVKREFVKAEIALQRAVESDPGAPQTLNDLAVAHLYQARIEKARELLQAVMDIDPQYAPPLFNMALCCLAEKKKEEARDYLRHFLRLKPGDARALKELAFLAASEGDYMGAIDYLTDAIENQPDWASLHFDAAAAAALMGQPEKAIGFLEDAEKLTSPRVTYKMYQQPAFRQIRMIELGKIFERHLADRARKLAAEKTAPEESQASVTEPISSASVSDSPAIDAAGTVRK